MIEVEIYSASKELLRAAVDATRDDVLAGTVEFGFTENENVEPTAWDTGAWESQEQSVEEINGKFVKAYIADILVSGTDVGGDHELAEGIHFAWTKVSMPDGQAIVKLAGKVTVL